MEQEFYVGPWLVEPPINRISCGSQSERVEPKVMGVLVLLSRNQGQVVSRDALFDEVWAGTVVTDDVLTRSVSELRKVFGDDPKAPGYIETIPKTGYRLVAPVSDRPIVIDHQKFGISDEGTVAAGRGDGQSILTMRIGLLALAVVLVVTALWTGLRPRSVETPLYPIPVTTYPGTESRPRLSPDGRQVAFSWRGEEQDNVDIYVKYVDAAPVLRLTNDTTANTNPAWSPDGTEIAFINRNGGCNIRIVSAIGGTPRTVGSCGASIYGDLTWSPDGAWLAFNDRAVASGPFSIHLMSPASGEKRSVTTPPSGIWGDHDPFFAPDGLRIGFVRSASEGMQDVFIADATGGNETRLTHETRNVWGGAWMTGVEHIIVASNRTGRPGLWRVNVSGGPLEWIGVQSPAAGFPSIAGNRLVFLQMDADVNLWRVPIERTGESEPFAPSTHWDLHPSVSPDASQVVFSSNRSGSYEIWVADSSGGSLRQLTEFDGPFTSTPRWSPDGSRIAFTGRVGGNADVFVMSLNASGPVRVTTNVADDLAPSWSSNGEDIIFTSNRSGSWEAWRVPTGGGEPIQLTYSGAFGARMLPDGERLLFSRPSDPGLWTLHLQSGRETEMVPSTDPRDWGSWDVVGDELYYLLREGGVNVIRRNLRTSLVDTVYLATNRVPAMDPAMAVSPDGAWLLIGQVDRQESDVMMVELE